MKKLSMMLVGIMLIACGGEAQQGSAEQAVYNGGSPYGDYRVIIYASDGLIVNGMFVNSDNDVLFNNFHSDQSHWSPQYWYGIDKDGSTAGVHKSLCNSLFGVWNVCQTAFVNRAYYTGGFSQRTPTTSVTVAGAGSVCWSGSMGTNPTYWYVEDGPYQDSYPDMTSGTLTGMSNYGSNNLCTPMGMGAFCYDYSQGTTCMWGDDGSLQRYYNLYLVGLGFGNKGAAWVNSTVASWLNNVI